MATNQVRAKNKTSGVRQTSPTKSAASPLSYSEWRGLRLYDEKLARAVERVRCWALDGLQNGAALVLAGDCGSGKTHIAREVGKAVSAYGVTACFFSEPDLLQSIRNGYGARSGDDVFGVIRRARLFILDDLGAGYVRDDSLPWVQEIYWRLFDQRFEQKRATLLTTNLRGDAFGVRLGTRALSRLTHAMGDAATGWVSLFGVPDYRQRGFSDEQ